MEDRTPLDRCLWERRRSNRSLARELGVHETQVSRWRSGLHVPEAERREAIAKALGTTVEYLWPEAAALDEPKAAA